MTGGDRAVRVLALVGTDHHPFDRLVRLVDHWFARQRQTGKSVSCLIQYGTSAPAATAEGRAYLERAVLDAELAEADLVVCHGGPSTIVEILRNGKLPLVMARDPLHGEHVDGHQMRFAAHMASRGLIVPVATDRDLDSGLEAVLRGDNERAIRGLDLPSPDDSARRLGALVQGLLSTPDRAARRR